MNHQRSSALPTVLFGLLLTSSGPCTAQAESPSELIRFLTYQSDRPEKKLVEMGLDPCSDFGDRRAAVALEQLGSAALPDIEKELDATEQRGPEGFGAGWLELAYAHIKGPAALERLRRLEQDPKFGSDRQFGDDSTRRTLDGAIALSLGLTSFVSAPGNATLENERQCINDSNHSSTLSSGPCPSGTHAEPPLYFRCDGRVAPRDALDRLIRAFERNDDYLFEAMLGPDAKAALSALLADKTWQQLRAEQLRSKSGDFAVGYRFEASGGWSEPPETLDYREPTDTRPEPMLGAHFKTRSGADCGTHWVRFLLSPTNGPVTPWTPYLVNSSDIAELVRVMGTCATAR